MYYPNLPSTENQFLAEHAKLLNNSFQWLFDTPLLDSNKDDLAEQLFYAPLVLLSHNTAADPLFNYANQKGLELFELDWEQLICLPSRASAEVINQAARDKLMAQVTSHGFIKGYEGVRISSSGKRFQINNAIIWNLHDEQGAYQGQAACFSEWVFL
ncbi:MAG: MEKHLA domain-containing protein [Methylococcaceae bacterium]|nr:MEKHLA domain-containing protein [Methylococcaceae bacterium]